MHKETYDIEKLKYYFKAYIYYKKEYPLRFSELGDKDFVEKENKAGFRMILIGVLILAIVWIFLGKYNNPGGIMEAIRNNDFLFISIMSGYMCIVHGAYIRLIIGRYQNLETYLSFKSPLTCFLSKFKKSVMKDASSEEINPIDIDEITVAIRNIMKLLVLINGPLIKFRKLGGRLPIEARNILEDFIKDEILWISQYTLEFREILSKWIRLHITELSEYQRKKLNTKNEKIYSLASTHFSSHIENLEKVRMHI